MLKIIELKHINKRWRIQIVTLNYSLFLQNKVVLPSKLLDSDASIDLSIKPPIASTIKTPILSCLVRAYTYNKNN